MTDPKPREELLRQAASIVAGDREQQYSGPEDSFRVIAALWNVYLSERDLGAPLHADDVAVMMALLKIARLTTGGTRQYDTWMDLAGYAACGWEVASRE